MELEESVPKSIVRLMSDMQHFEIYVCHLEHVELYHTILRGCSNLRCVKVSIPHDAADDVDYCNRFLRAMHQCEKLEHILICGSIYGEESNFKNEMDTAQLSLFS